MVKAVLMENMDLVIAAIMIAVGILALILSRLKLMPGKGAPFIIGAIIGIVGITVFNRAKAKRLKKDVADLEKRIAERQKEIDAATKDLERRDEILKQAQKEYEESLKNYKRNAVSYHIKSREEYESMSDEDIFAAFDGIGTPAAKEGNGS
jgi:uncharacterized membrane protein YgaE (UPF0421/DUF939 family)